MAAKKKNPAPKKGSTLEGWRGEIDRIDAQITALLDARARAARAIGAIKRGAGLPMYDAGRHINKLNEFAARPEGEFPAEGLRHVFGEILSACLALEETQQVAYLGPEATFSHIAALRVFGQSARFEPEGSIPDIFSAVERGRAHFGIVPVENSTGGVIHTTLDALMNSNLSICAEVHIPIRHNLMCRGEMKKIKRVATHPQILSQCRNWLLAHLPAAIQIDAPSSAEGLKMALRDKTVAGIGPEAAARLYNIPILARGIEDRGDNITRFLVIGRQSPRPSGQDRTSVMFCFKDEPGALEKLLRPCARRGINLTKIESRPSRRRAWDYIFFVDMRGHMSEPAIAAALREMKKHTTFLRVLGSYPMDASAASKLV